MASTTTVDIPFDEEAALDISPWVYGDSDSPAIAATPLPGSKARNTNPVLNFLLAGYNDPSAKPGDIPSVQTSKEAMAGMRRRALCEAYRLRVANAVLVAEEALSRVFNDVGRSNLCATYRPSPRGLRPYVNQILHRKVLQVATEARSRPPLTLTEHPSRELDPSQIVELSDLEQRCRDIIPQGQSDWSSTATVSNASTFAVNKHRRRKRAWAQVAYLFPELRLRPKQRRR